MRSLYGVVLCQKHLEEYAEARKQKPSSSQREMDDDDDDDEAVSRDALKHAPELASLAAERLQQAYASRNEGLLHVVRAQMKKRGA